MIDFVKSTEMKISLAPDQEGMLSTKETIKTIIRDNPDTVLAFDIFDENDLIGFILVNRFEEHKYFLWESANGISSSAVTAESPANKGYGNSVTLPYDVTDTENAHHILLSLCETVGARIRYDKAYISVVQVQIVDNDFHHRCKQLSLPSATNVTEKIYEAACNAFDQGWDHAPIRLLGVSTSKATDESYEQYNLFDQDKFERLSKLNSAIDKIRDKYGDDAIVRACFADTHKN